MRDRRLILAIEATQLNALADFWQDDLITPEQMYKVEALPMKDVGDPTPYDPLMDICNFLSDCGIWWGPRAQLEEMPAFRQLIPYIVLHRKEDDKDQFLIYERHTTGGEARLHGKLAIGLGGHIDFEDGIVTQGQFNLMETVGRSAAREMLEEVGLMTNAAAMDCLGLAIASDTEVSTVHVGLVLVMDVVGTVASKEEDQHNLEWLTVEEIEALPRDRSEGFTYAVGRKLREYLEQKQPEPSTIVVGLPTL